MGYHNRRSKRLRKHLNFLTLMAQVLKSSIFLMFFLNTFIYLIKLLFLLFFLGTIDAKELNVAMRYGYQIIYEKNT